MAAKMDGMDNHISCISQHPVFQEVYLNVLGLRTTYYLYQQHYGIGVHSSPLHGVRVSFRKMSKVGQLEDSGDMLPQNCFKIRCPEIDSEAFKQVFEVRGNPMPHSLNETLVCVNSPVLFFFFFFFFGWRRWF